MVNFRVPSIRSELLPKANGEEAMSDLALRRAENEKKAQEAHNTRIDALRAHATRLAGIDNPSKPHSTGEFHIPDIKDEAA